MSSNERFSREEVLAALDAWRAAVNACDWDRFTDLFTENCTWVNSMLAERIVGREALRSLTRQWPAFLLNNAEWITVDGDRVAVGWNERQSPSGPAIRGISTLVYAGSGRFSHYEGMFDTAAVAALGG